MYYIKGLAWGGAALLVAASVSAQTSVNSLSPTNPTENSNAVRSGAVQIFVVSTPEELRSALQSARTIVGGAVIRLRPGNYGTLVWKNKAYTLGRVFLVPATTTRPAFTGMDLGGSKGMAISGMLISGSDRAVVSLSGSVDMIFAGNIVTGTNRNFDAWDDESSGIYVRFASRITITQNLLEDLQGGTFIQRSNRVQYDHNTLRYVREGLNVAATDDLDITGNYFHDFQPNIPNGEHPDSIQFWTANESVGSSNVRLRENVMMHGGCAAVQGIFIRSETTNHPDGPQIRHRNFTLRNNLYYGASKHGMTMGSIDTVLAENNVIIASPYSETGISRVDAQAKDPHCGGALQPAILSTNGTTGHVIRRNITTQQGKTDAQLSDNIVVGRNGEPYAGVFQSRPTGTTPDLSAFLTKNPSAARTRNVGIQTTYAYGATMTPGRALRRALAIHKP